MAIVTRQTGSPFLRALGGAVKGAKEGIDIATKLQNAETQRGFLQEQIKSMQARQAEAQDKKKASHNLSLSTMASQAILTGDTNTFLKNREQDIRRDLEGSGSQLSFEQFGEMARINNQEGQQAVKDFEQSKARLLTLTPNTGNLADIERLQSTAIDAVRRITSIPELSTENKKLWISWGKDIDTFANERQSQFVAADVAQAKGQIELKKSGLKAAKAVDKDAKIISDRVANIDRSFQALNKVTSGLLGTGPVVGSKLVSGIRRALGDTDFEILDAMLNKEGLETVKEVAKEAGARSIDTEREREYLERTTPGVNNRPKTIETLLLVSKSQLMAAELTTNARAEHLKTGGADEDFQNPLETKRSFYNPATFDIKFVAEGEKPPKGFKPLSGRITEDLKRQAKEGEPEQQTGESAAQRFLNKRISIGSGQ